MGDCCRGLTAHSQHTDSGCSGAHADLELEELASLLMMKAQSADTYGSWARYLWDRVTGCARPQPVFTPAADVLAVAPAPEPEADSGGGSCTGGVAVGLEGERAAACGEQEWREVGVRSEEQGAGEGLELSEANPLRHVKMAVARLCGLGDGEGLHPKSVLGAAVALARSRGLAVDVEGIKLKQALLVLAAAVADQGGEGGPAGQVVGRLLPPPAAAEPLVQVPPCAHTTPLPVFDGACTCSVCMGRVTRRGWGVRVPAGTAVGRATVRATASTQTPRAEEERAPAKGRRA